MYFVVLFVSPLYFLLRKRWGGFIINAVLYGIALVFVASIFFAWFAVVPWLLAVIHATWHYRLELGREMMEEHASLIAAKMAEQTKLASAPRAVSTSNVVADTVRPPMVLPALAASTFCESCGAKIGGGSTFCDECGVRVAS